MTDTVAQLWRFPVKSMQGESLSALPVTRHGVVGDRAYGVLDVETGRIASAKQVRLFPGLMRCRAVFVAPPAAGMALPPVRIELPDGVTVGSDDAEVDAVLSNYFGRAARLVRAPAAVATYDAYRADWPASDAAATGALRDAYPASLLTRSTLRELAELSAGSRFGPRRFRMNFILDTDQAGFVENDWPGRALGLGGDLRLRVCARDSRCIMTTLAQADLLQDAQILRTIARHNKVPVEGHGERPCAGVYAQVMVSGVVRVGDALSWV